MTEAEILAMPAGKQMDGLISEWMFGWTQIRDDYPWPQGNQTSHERWYGMPPNWRGGVQPVPDFSTELAQAWKLLETLGFMFCVTMLMKMSGPYEVVIYCAGPQVARGSTAPEAICRAALLTMLVTSSASPTTSPPHILNEIIETEILAMPAGRELDALVAEKMMGWHKELDGTVWCDQTNIVRAAVPPLKPKWNPSEDIAVAWQVVEKLALPFDLRNHGCPNPETPWIASFKSSAALVGASGETPSLAICRAALLTSTASPTTSPPHIQERSESP